MKPINLTQEAEIELMKKCLQKIHEGIEKYKFDMNDTKFSFSMDMSEEAIHNIAVAGVLHDLGKEKIPLEIINKPSKLTPEEFAIMKKLP